MHDALGPVRGPQRHAATQDAAGQVPAKAPDSKHALKLATIAHDASVRQRHLLVDAAQEACADYKRPAQVSGMQPEDMVKYS